MNDTIDNDEELTAKIKKNFITNIIFGQKLINNLSCEKNKNVTIDYFMSHIKNFKKQISENWEMKINFEKYVDLIPQNIQEKLKDDTDIVFKNKNYIEPYCKKPMKISTPLSIFKKIGFHYKLVKLESQFYDLFGMIHYQDKIIGYICLGKKNGGVYKNLYVVIHKPYEEGFYENKKKKLIIINEMTEEIGFFERDCYSRYLKYLRSILFSFVVEILKEHETVKNVICIGNEEGGNFLQLFTMDIINNKNDLNVKFADDLSFYLFTNNTAMLSTETFYNDLVTYLGNPVNSMLTCFEERNNAYDTWEFNENKRQKYNVIVLK